LLEKSDVKIVSFTWPVAGTLHSYGRYCQIRHSLERSPTDIIMSIRPVRGKRVFYQFNNIIRLFPLAYNIQEPTV